MLTGLIKQANKGLLDIAI